MDRIPKTMQAAVYRGPNDIRLETLPVPRIGANELLVKVAVCGVCPTDIKKIHYGTVPPPRVFGHETSGTIVRAGARVRGFTVGERVALHHHIPCMECHYCKHRAFAQCETYKRTGITAGFEPAGGGYAEYVRVLPFVFQGVVKIPRRNTFLEGAMLEPVNTVLKGVRRLSLLPGDNALVVGVGPIGLMFTRLLALEGIRVFASDLVEPRLRLAKKFGARLLLNPKDPQFAARLRRASGKQGLDAAIICAPVDAAVQQAQELVHGAGKVLLFAHTKRGQKAPVDLAAICVDEKDLIGSYSADVTLQKAVARLVFDRLLPVQSLITHRFPLAETKVAVDLAAHPTAESLKVVVEQGGFGQ
jgi:L-iditol 2-dehydrogenase